jgi:glutathione peroxidase
LAFVTGVADAQAAACPALLDRSVPRLQDEKDQSLCQYSGKVLLIVNTASACGYTPQYQGLEKLHEQYRECGLVVMGFPSNDFAGQEPGWNFHKYLIGGDGKSVRSHASSVGPEDRRLKQEIETMLNAR